jgi:hypothetical protein
MGCLMQKRKNEVSTKNILINLCLGWVTEAPLVRAAGYYCTNVIRYICSIWQGGTNLWYSAVASRETKLCLMRLHVLRMYVGVEGWMQSFLILTLDGIEWSPSCPGHLTPQKKGPRLPSGKEEITSETRVE